MSISVNAIRATLVGGLNASTRPPALHPLAYIKYPGRELQPRQQSDGSVTVSLAKFGFEYKHRGPKPKLLPIDPEAIRATFNTALSGSGFQVRSVQDTQKQIILIMEETQPC